MIKHIVTWLLLALLISAVAVTVLAAPPPYNGYPATPSGFIKPGSGPTLPEIPGPANDAIDRATGTQPGSMNNGQYKGSGTTINRTMGSGTGGTGDAGGSSGSGAGTGAGSSAGGGRSGQ
jgi:uncharacterized membrane protein YgcG